MKILHVTESLAAGVGYYVTMVIHAQVAAGHELILAHSIRSDTPSTSDLEKCYSGVRRRHVIDMVTQVSLWRDILSAVALIRLMRSERPDVVHLHSSKAGVLGRLAARFCGVSTRVFYSPHGFAFLREDVSSRKRALFLLFEQLAARLGGVLVSCSRSEGELAESMVKHPRVCLVENAVDLDAVPLSSEVDAPEVLVLNAGRVCFQKGPWRFLDVAKRCVQLPARFIWIGDGELKNDLLDPTNVARVTVTGWLSRDRVLAVLARGGVFLMTSLWEGMPLALIEAQAAGIPAVVPNVIGCKDVVIDGETGFVCDNDEDMLARVKQLITDPDLRKLMGHNAAELARKRFSVTRLNDELLDLYAAPTE